MQTTIGAQRASSVPHAVRRFIVLIAAAAGLAGVLALARPAATAAADDGGGSATRPKVVIVVGPVGRRTAEYKATGRALARQARSYGARVIEVYSPWATWPKVVRAARGANLLVYLGHGNGWPSPYGPYQPYTKNGLGLNAVAGGDNHRVAYRGEYYLRQQLELAPGAVVLLNGLCYASGNAEGNAPTPKRRVAKARADHYARGFQAAGASVVFALGTEDPGHVLRGLFKTDRTMRQIFWSSPKASPGDRVAYAPKRSAGRAILDPHRGRYYFRSVVGDLDLKATRWR